MKRIVIRKERHDKVGLSPGSLVFSGRQWMEKPMVKVMRYNVAELVEEEIDLTNGLPDYADAEHVVWINVCGLHDPELIKLIGDRFSLHPLVLEDIMNTNQRPKLEPYDDYLFLVVKMLDYLADSGEVLEEQFTVVVKGNTIITFQEQEGDIFEQVKTRIRNSKGKIRSRSSDYLSYALLDAIVDEYFIILEAMGEELEKLEEQMIHEASSSSYLERMQTIKRELLGIRTNVWPIREVLNGLIRMEHDVFTKETILFLRDVHDHSMQVAETIETYREILASIQDLYLSVMNNKMNEVMKVLAGISTIFLPMTLVAGIYGMNFEFMPELKANWGYPAALVLMGLIGVGMYFYFRTRKWF